MCLNVYRCASTSRPSSTISALLIQQHERKSRDACKQAVHAIGRDQAAPTTLPSSPEHSRANSCTRMPGGHFHEILSRTDEQPYRQKQGVRRRRDGVRRRREEDQKEGRDSKSRRRSRRSAPQSRRRSGRSIRLTHPHSAARDAAINEVPMMLSDIACDRCISVANVARV